MHHASSLGSLGAAECSTREALRYSLVMSQAIADTPPLGSTTADMRADVFSSLVGRLSRSAGEVFPLHVGDTWLDPTPAARMEALQIADHPDLHRYAPPPGLPSLRQALLERERGATGLAIELDQVLITAGATSGLHCVLSVLLDPGDEVIVLAPHWPLIVGIIRACRGNPVLADVLEALQGEATRGVDLVEAVEARRTPRTRALYISSPNNPSGHVLPSAALEELAEWARSAKLWLISDEVYEELALEVEHQRVAALAPERTISSFSFSKTYGLAGTRCGYVTGPAEVIGEATKIATHSFYNAPTPGQIAALAALEHGAGWLDEARDAYREIGARCAAALGVGPPEGGTFLFLDLHETLGEQTLLAFLELCADRGLLLAPGPSFGDYSTWARFCFTCVPPEQTMRGVALLRNLMDDFRNES